MGRSLGPAPSYGAVPSDKQACCVVSANGPARIVDSIASRPRTRAWFLHIPRMQKSSPALRAGLSVTDRTLECWGRRCRDRLCNNDSRHAPFQEKFVFACRKRQVSRRRTRVRAQSATQYLEVFARGHTTSSQEVESDQGALSSIAHPETNIETQ